MGNRAVIVSHDTNKDNANKKIGIYVHWHGSEDTVKDALTKAKELGVRGIDNDDLYFWARFCQTFANIMTEEDLQSEYESAKLHAYESGIGIGIVSQLDCQNYDNGVYYIDNNFDIVKHTDGSELEDNTKTSKQQLWQVTQTQRDEMYDNTPIYTTTNYNEAVECARKLNKQFGRGCAFTPDGDFDYEVADSDYVHFYKVEGTKLGIDLDNVLFQDDVTEWVIEIFKDEIHCGWLDTAGDINQSYDEAWVCTNYAKAVNFARERTDENSKGCTYCVCPKD